MRAPIVLARGEFFREGRRKKDTSLPSTRFSGRFWIVMSRNCSSLGAPVTLRSMAAALRYHSCVVAQHIKELHSL